MPNGRGIEINQSDQADSHLEEEEEDIHDERSNPLYCIRTWPEVALIGSLN
jgi:hypothetical protein